MQNPPDCSSEATSPEQDVIVKSEQESDVSSVEMEEPDLYEEHEIKEEMVVGPVVLQKVSVVDNVIDGLVWSYSNIDTSKMSDRSFHVILTPSAHRHNTKPDLNPQESKQPIVNKKYNRKMTCKVYNEELQTKTTLKQKDVILENVYMYVCDYCKREYKRKSALVNHIRVHTDEYEFKCSTYEKKFYDRHLRTHLVANHHACKICSKTFSFLDNLKVHQLTHKTKNENVFCEICQKQLKRTNLTEHYRVHTEEKPFKCEICDERFCSKRKLRNHQENHKRIKQFPCDICHKQFNSKRSWRKHQAKHIVIKLFHCDTCDQDFYNRKSLQYHQVNHSSSKRFICDICGKQFCKKRSLQEHHQVKHTGIKPFSCDICDKQFYSKRRLQEHLLTHTDTKPVPCDICDKHFCNKKTLRNHLRVHSGIKPFKCTSCSRCFSRKYNMLVHQRTHINENSHICEMCGKHFRYQYLLRRHMRKCLEKSSQ